MYSAMKKVMDILQHHNPKRPQYAPHLWTVPKYGKILKMAPDPEDSNLLEKKATKIIQSTVGTILYYARSVDTTMLREINEISQVQSKPTMDTEKKSKMLLDYAATYPNAIIRYKVSNMVPYDDSDVAYLTMPEARSCYVGHLYLSDWPSPSMIKPNPKRNGPVHT